MKHIFASRIAHSLWRHWRWSFAWQHRICVIVLNLAKNINLPISSCEFPRKPTCGDLVEQAFEVRIVWFFCAKHGSASLHARRACLQYPTSPAAPSVKFFFFFSHGPLARENRPYYCCKHSHNHSVYQRRKPRT